MKRLALFCLICLMCKFAIAQDIEIVETQRRLAIINAGSEQGIQKSDTLWVNDVSDKKDHLVAKALVIALRKKFAAIEAFQYFGDYRLATGQRVFRVKDVPAPLTAPPRITRRATQKPELTLAEVHRQLLRVFVFAGGIAPFGNMSDSFSGSFGAGLGVRVHVFSSIHMSLSGRYVFLRNSAALDKSLNASGAQSSSSQVLLALAVRPVMGYIFVEGGPALFATRTTTSGIGPQVKSTFFDGGVVVGAGRYFELNDRLAWVLQANLHTYFANNGVNSFFDLNLQLHF